MRITKTILLSLALASCVGPAGENGLKGLDGVDGVDGQDGAHGNDGVDGQDGADGEDGLDASAGIHLEQLGRYSTGQFDESAAEIVAFDPASERIFVVNAQSGMVDVLDASDPTDLVKVDAIDVTENAGTLLLGAANSVAVSGGLVAVAVENDDKQADGVVQFYTASNLDFQAQVDVCALPDNVVFTPDGSMVLAACEGEPNDAYTVDPEGGVAIIDLSGGVSTATADIAGFTSFNGERSDLRDRGVRIYGPSSTHTDGEATVAEDIEPEYIAISDDGSTAWVSLQENNALAKVDIATAEVTDILPLGTKDHTLPGHALDVSDKDDRVALRNWPVLGMLMPDAIAAYDVGGSTYIVTANEGDARDYEGYSEEVRVDDLTLDQDIWPDAAEIQLDHMLGRLKTTTAHGDLDGDGDHDVIYAYGGRSFSIFDGETGRMVFDSGDDFATILAQRYGHDFNQSNDETKGDARSDDKGTEPEALALGHIDGHTYAFIGLERMGGIMVYDITHPESPRFIQYETNRDLTVDIEADWEAAGDLGPEGMAFIDADDSPTGEPLLVVGNEVSGTTTVYAVRSLID